LQYVADEGGERKVHREKKGAPFATIAAREAKGRRELELVSSATGEGRGTRGTSKEESRPGYHD